MIRWIGGINIMECPLSTTGYNTQSFDKNNFSKLKGVMYERHVSKGEKIYWEGEGCEYLYYLKQGSVKLTKSSDDGKDLVLYYFQPRDLFGDLRDNINTTNSYSAEAMSDCTLGVIQQKDLETLLWQNGDLAIDFMKWLGYMQRFLQTKLRDLLFFGKHGALASTLIRMSNTFGVSDGDSIRISNKFTNSEIADLIGSTRETVNRMLNQMKKDNIIGYECGIITINDMDQLKDICHCEGCPKSICRL